MIKKTTSSCLMYLDANNLYGWAMSQKPSVNGLERAEDLSQFKENFKTIMMETVIRDIFLK